MTLITCLDMTFWCKRFRPIQIKWATRPTGSSPKQVSVLYQQLYVHIFIISVEAIDKLERGRIR